MPIFLYPTAKIAAGDQTRFVIIGAVIGSAGMRNIDGDQGNAGFAILCRDNRSNLLIGLELDDQVHFFAHQQIGVVLRDLRVVAIVQRNQLNSFHRCGALQAGGHFPGELIVRPLRGVSKTIKLLFPGPEA